MMYLFSFKNSLMGIKVFLFLNGRRWGLLSFKPRACHSGAKMESSSLGIGVFPGICSLLQSQKENAEWMGTLNGTSGSLGQAPTSCNLGLWVYWRQGRVMKPSLCVCGRGGGRVGSACLKSPSRCWNRISRAGTWELFSTNAPDDFYQVKLRKPELAAGSGTTDGR